MSRIMSVAQSPGDDDLFLCGDYQPNEASDTAPYGSNVLFKAVIARMNNEGEVSWIITSSGKHPLYDGTNYQDQDRCKAVAFNKVED